MRINVTYEIQKTTVGGATDIKKRPRSVPSPMPQTINFIYLAENLKQYLKIYISSFSSPL